MICPDESNRGPIKEEEKKKQAGAELGQAQVKLDDIVVIVVAVVESNG